MPEQTTEAAPQPVAAPIATQTSGEGKTTSAGNQTVSQYARRFITPEAAPAETETATLAGETLATETVKPVPAEANPDTETKAETPELTEKEKADEVLSKSTSQQIEFTPEQQEVFNKRLGREVAKRKELERIVEELKKTSVVPANEEPTPKVETPAAIVPLPVGAPPLANINDVRGLLDLQQQAKEAIRFAEDALANEADGEPVPEGWTRKSLREVIRNAKLTVEDHIPARSQFLQQKHSNQQTAYELLPWLKEKEDPKYVLAQTFRKNNPWLENLPAADLMIGMYIRGVEAVKAEREATEKAKGSKPEGKKVTARPTGAQTDVSTDASPTRTTQGTQKAQAMKAIDEKLKAKGSVSAKDYASALANKEILKNR